MLKNLILHCGYHENLKFLSMHYCNHYILYFAEHVGPKFSPKRPTKLERRSDLLDSNKSQLMHNMTSLSQDDILMESNINDNAAVAQMLTAFPLDEANVFSVFPARPPSDGFMYSSRTSLNSLDNIIEPPCRHVQCG